MPSGKAEDPKKGLKLIAMAACSISDNQNQHLYATQLLSMNTVTALLESLTALSEYLDRFSNI